MMIERLSFEGTEQYSSLEAAIHLARYSIARGLCAGKRVLDISCGEGYGSSFLATEWGAAEVHGVDISEEAITRARQNFGDDRITFHCSSADDLEDLFEAETFDLIVSLETMEHVPDAASFLATLGRLRKKDGAMVLSCPNDWYYYPEADQGNPFHVRKFTYDEFLELAEQQVGRPDQVLLGLPTAGFCNVDVLAPVLQNGAGDSTPLAMKRVQDPVDAAMLPADHDVDAETCSYFVGVWGARVSPAAFTVFPSSMERSALAREQQVVRELRDDNARLRHEAWEREGLEQRLRDAELLAAAWRAECEYVRQVAAERSGVVATPPSLPRRGLNFAYSIYSRLRDRLRGR
ncbi:MAG: class I SAM-dependent methyltransferase [bacterium]|nr:class I SAM-dependent methyltransferase [bacterium]